MLSVQIKKLKDLFYYGSVIEKVNEEKYIPIPLSICICELLLNHL